MVSHLSHLGCRKVTRPRPERARVTPQKPFGGLTPEGSELVEGAIFR